MPTVYIARRDALRSRQAQACLEASRSMRVLGVAQTVWHAGRQWPPLKPDALLLDLRLEDGAALSLVRELRARGSDRPRAMVLAADAADPLLFATLAAGADAYLLEADLALAAPAIERMLQGEATLAAPIARRMLQFFGEPMPAPQQAVSSPGERTLDWRSHAGNPLKLSPGERRLLQMLALGARHTEAAQRLGLSLEAVGRRVGNLYRKLSWDVRSGALSLLAA
jgi:DNA-binding NarL/FixJ family response regulator